MTSETYVYIYLPHETAPVLAGRFRSTADREGSRLAEFIYGKSYLARAEAVELDPLTLKLSPTLYKTTAMNGIFGAIRDAGPDFWGQRVIERHCGRTQLDQIDYLLQSPDDRAGALGFGLGAKPPAPKRKFNKTLDLEQLRNAADALLRDEIAAGEDVLQARDLLLLGTSMGGARPKAVVEDDSGLWVAKFSRRDDRWNNPRVEAAMLELARTCGINAARNRIESIGGDDVLLVQRFDRERTTRGYFRARMISSLTLLRAEETASIENRRRWSYVLLAEEMRRVVSNPKHDCAELFRRMCFNALISNADDHPRNHALIAFDRAWRLSPAYDLTPSPQVTEDRRDLAMTCGSFGRYANRFNLLSECARFLLTRDEAEQIINDMYQRVRTTWYDTVRACGVSERDAEMIRSAFDYPGFNYELGHT